MTVPDDCVGQEDRCPVCQQRVIVPDRSLEASADEKPAISAAESSSSENLVCAVPEIVVAAPTALTPAAGAAGVGIPLPGQPLPQSRKPPAPGDAGHVTILSPPSLPPPLLSAVPAPPPTSVPPSAAAAKAPVQWSAWAPADALAAYPVVRASPRQLEIAYWLACLLPFATLFSVAPALPHLELAGAPAWSRVMLLMAMLELAYAAWLAMLPDGSTVRVGTVLFAAIALLYLFGMAALGVLPEPALASLGLTGMRWTAVAWCALALLTTAGSSAACHWVGRHWQA